MPVIFVWASVFVNLYLCGLPLFTRSERFVLKRWSITGDLIALYGKQVSASVDGWAKGGKT